MNRRNGTIKIEKGIALPTDTPPRKGKYPWRNLEIGDSFFVNKDMARFYPQIYAASKRTGFTFTSRSQQGGTRIWRIK